MSHLILSDGTSFEGEPIGAAVDTDGEVVFTTNMAGYPESLTDPSYRGQILVFTYPLIGNYGVPSLEKNDQPSLSSGELRPASWGFSRNYESERVQVQGVVIATASEDFSHFTATSSLHRWLEHFGIPGICGIDTRALTKKLREHGVMLGALRDAPLCHAEEHRAERGASRSTVSGAPQGDICIEDPNLRNLVAEVSCKELVTYEPKEFCGVTVAAYDCGMKRNILRSFLKRGVRVHRLPWDFDLDASDLTYDGLFVSNGPGDPKMCTATVAQMSRAMEKGTPTFGICLGNQLMALAVSGDTFKLKYGHRGANQPCIEQGTDRCIITSQNHGFAVSPKSLPKEWNVWFTNANDGSVEGIRHSSGKFFAVQFHPEATPGPEDANYLFDEFVAALQ